MPRVQGTDLPFAQNSFLSCTRFFRRAYPVFFKRLIMEIVFDIFLWVGIHDGLFYDFVIDCAGARFVWLITRYALVLKWVDVNKMVLLELLDIGVHMFILRTWGITAIWNVPGLSVEMDLVNRFTHGVLGLPQWQFLSQIPCYTFLCSSQPRSLWNNLMETWDIPK